MDITLNPEELIKKAQALLIITGHDDGGRLIANGRMGQHTRNALLAFQRMHGLQTTGELDENTLAKMSDGSYEPVRNERDPIRMVQAAMILSGLDDGTLFANGRLDEPTRERLPVFIAFLAISASNLGYCLSLHETERDEATEQLLASGARAETVTAQDDSPPASVLANPAMR